jgi:hypothetical protein
VIVALVSDLMDRSRLTGALDDVLFARDVEGCAGADVVIVDLGRHADSVVALRAALPSARIVAFGAHVDNARLAQAETDGADVALPRSRFFRDPAAEIA